MRSRGVRVFLAVVAAAAVAAAGLAAWQFDQRGEAERSAADGFEREARLAVLGLADLRASQQAAVAAGQRPDQWLARAATLRETLGPKIAALRVAAMTAEAQGALETAIEAFTTFGQGDARAREYLRGGQPLAASDVIFADAVPTLEKTANLIDSARAQESIARAIAVANARKWEAVAAGAGVFIALLALILLVPIPRGEDARAESQATEAGGGLGRLAIGQEGPALRTEAAIAAPVPAVSDSAAHGAPAAAVSAPAPDCDALAGVCSALAQVQDTDGLQALFAPIARALDATGIIVWMPDTTHGALRPAMSHGYPPQALARMGAIAPSSDNATATAFRTRTVVAVPPEAPAHGAVVAPLITADGCSGAMAVELREGVDPARHVRAAAAIVAAQLATLLTPAEPAEGAPAADPAARRG